MSILEIYGVESKIPQVKSSVVKMLQTIYSVKFRRNSYSIYSLYPMCVMDI